MVEKKGILTFKLVLIGDGGIGKVSSMVLIHVGQQLRLRLAPSEEQMLKVAYNRQTTFVKRHETGELRKTYIATQGAEVRQLRFATNRGPIQFDVWDTAGQEKFGPLRETYYHGAQCAIIMFDLTAPTTLRNIPSWTYDARKGRQYDIPIVVVGNKVDMTGEITLEQIARYAQGEKICILSAKSNFNYEKPFLILLRRLTQNPTLKFVKPPALVPPEVQLESAAVKKLEEEVQEAAITPLPDEGYLAL
ncbi:GTP-binding nuclear protein gsp1/Ran [Saxophila tyrrhenica]|uniref:GTP-binding nuclear protein n=1 Tax=Saxophila tyrrhenica TaxID=1690608 RepID=A0AAV9NUG1_9PEZI|nr:GTP-binding nuclear protein gsp1/Ran [Saxophila tyrrhenica]